METYSYLEQFPLKGNGVIVISALTALKTRQSTEDYTTERNFALADNTSPSSPILISMIPLFPFSLKLEAGERQEEKSNGISSLGSQLHQCCIQPVRDGLKYCLPFPEELLFTVGMRKPCVFSTQPQNWKMQAWLILILYISEGTFK